jgi:hypothetical protein
MVSGFGVINSHANPGQSSPYPRTIVKVSPVRRQRFGAVPHGLWNATRQSFRPNTWSADSYQIDAWDVLESRNADQLFPSAESYPGPVQGTQNARNHAP